MRRRAIKESVAPAGEQPVGIGARQLDETKDRRCGDGGSGLVVMQGAEWDLQSLREERGLRGPRRGPPGSPRTRSANPDLIACQSDLSSGSSMVKLRLHNPRDIFGLSADIEVAIMSLMIPSHRFKTSDFKRSGRDGFP